jgi:hypothetical protein
MKYRLYTLIIILCFFFTKSTAQYPFIVSSVGTYANASSISSPTHFTSSNTCIDVQTGIAVLKGYRSNGLFVLNCTIDWTQNNLGIKLYPNPVGMNSKLRLTNTPSLTAIFTVYIWTEEGKLIRTQKESGYNLYQGVHMDLSQLQAGGYILKIVSDHFTDAIKFIKAQ